MSLNVQEKIDIGTQKKELGDQAFKTGEIKDALRAYHEALLYLNGIDRSALQGIVPSVQADSEGGNKKTEVEEMVEKIYANQSACHIKSGNWKRALEAADKALAKNENNLKAAFRKGKAQGELGFTDLAERTLQDLLKKNPADAAAINAEIARFRAADAEQQRQLDKKLRGFLTRSKDKETKVDGPNTSSPDTTAASP